MTYAPLSPRKARGASTPLPEKVLAKFGGPKARPRLVQSYNPRLGWTRDRRREAVTLELLAALKAGGVTLVEARWRSTRARINLAGLDLPK
jgi:hypothetical protein